MRMVSIFYLIAIFFLVSACSQQTPSHNPSSSNISLKQNKNISVDEPDPHNFILVKGGTVKNKKSNFYGKGEKISSFYIGKNEVTQKEWTEVMGSNPSQFKGDKLPVEMVSWYDAIEYCNKRSIQEGLKPYYNIIKNKKDSNNKSEYDNLKWTVTINSGSNGYRLPTEIEWEYAASGGQMSKNYTYSGSNDINEVAWYWRNSGDKYLSGNWNWPAIENNHGKPKTVGLKNPNELGLYDMSGNVREWCWNWYGDSKSGSWRVTKGGGWIGGDTSVQIDFSGKFDPNGIGPDQGFRVVRSK